MPTIGQLPPASSVSDTDEIAIFQNDQTLSATRAQILAGTQTALTLPANTLLGGVGPGTAAPVPITIGANLSLAGSTLSATATPFQIPSLSAGNTPAPADLVPLGQGGHNVAVSYSTFLSGMGAIAGLPAGTMTAKASGASTTRTISALAANAVAIEDFGAAGDGLTDDSAALLAAIAAGVPVRLGPKVYAIAGECDIIGTTATLLGTPGLSVLKRSAQTRTGTSATPAWISVSASSFYADGVIFDGNTSVTNDTCGVALQASCTASLITRCVFRNVEGVNNGSGLVYVSSDPTLTKHSIDDCEFGNNRSCGVYGYAVDGLSVTNCQAHDNGAIGIFVNIQDPAFVLKVREPKIVGNTCWNNNLGIVVGNFFANNVVAAPLNYGTANPDVLGALVASNNCYNNPAYGIYISGRNILVSGNLCMNNGVTGGGAGILCDTEYCKITGNMIYGASAFGIDCGGSIYTTVDHNYINGAGTGLNIGGGQYCTARANFIQDCAGTAIGAQNVESDGIGDNFGLACTGLSIVGNWINYSGGSTGILVRDGVQNVLVEENVIMAQPGATQANALSAYTDSITIRRNVLNFTTRWAVNPALVNGVYTLTVPDIADAVSITQATAPVASIVTSQGSLTAGQVTFIKVTNAGLGYTSATVSISGTGTGAAAFAWVSGGKVIGIQMSSFGSGYGAGTTVSITGNGAGAAAVAHVGLPVWTNKELTIDCLAATRFATTGSSPVQSNWTGAPITVPAGASIDWVGYNNGWRAARFTQSDYVSPNGDGSLTVKTQLGDISLHPAGSGMVRIISDAESVGAVELIGRGSPLNTISAPAGSTFRNLNGGVGSTFWVKQSGTGSTNWVAVA